MSWHSRPQRPRSFGQHQESRPLASGYVQHNLVPRASFPLTSGRKTRALGATISGMRHRCRCAVSRITRIRLFPLFFHNGCSQSSRFPTAGQGERSSGNEIASNTEVRDSRTSRHSAHVQSQVWQIWLVLVSSYCVYKAIQKGNVVGPEQRSRFLVLTKRSAASGDENDVLNFYLLSKIN